MKRFLKWLVNFLDRKFPDKVVVREEDFLHLQTSLVETNGHVIKLMERVAALEANVLNVNQAMGFSSPKLGMLER